VKVKHILIFVVGLSVVALMVSVAILLSNISESNIPSGITQVEIPNDGIKKVTIDSKSYDFSLVFFTEYGQWCEMKVQTSSGGQIRNLYLGKPSTFYDLKVTMKESLADSVIVWIEKS